MIVVPFLVLAALGATLRAVVGHHLNRPAFAWGTLAVNVTGSFALGLLHDAGGAARTLLGVAFLGALTTFSSFVRDALALVEANHALRALVYLVGTVAMSVAAAWLGMQLT